MGEFSSKFWWSTVTSKQQIFVNPVLYENCNEAHDNKVRNEISIEADKVDGL